eukprot:GHVS01104316.1.p1 GENE.GHVS01104316.1~~GHVS01104316.1.p1  ORF type:complete len:147 (-),score=8.49 GHVS01104316.1:185-625(-)
MFIKYKCLLWLSNIVAAENQLHGSTDANGCYKHVISPPLLCPCEQYFLSRHQQSVAQPGTSCSAPSAYPVLDSNVHVVHTSAHTHSYTVTQHVQQRKHSCDIYRCRKHTSAHARSQMRGLMLKSRLWRCYNLPCVCSLSLSLYHVE